jgi:hypothetical protein
MYFYDPSANVTTVGYHLSVVIEGRSFQEPEQDAGAPGGHGVYVRRPFRPL